MLAEITYAWLFVYLAQLGFKDLSRSKFERIFEHAGLGIFLAFSMLDDATIDRPVRTADIASVETRLQQHGLLSGTLAETVQKVSEL